MEKYRVINSFKDLEDNNHIYIKDKDIYPREGLEPTKKRIKELTSTKNKIGKVLIEEIENEETNTETETEETNIETETEETNIETETEETNIETETEETNIETETEETNIETEANTSEEEEKTQATE